MGPTGGEIEASLRLDQFIKSTTLSQAQTQLLVQLPHLQRVQISMPIAHLITAHFLLQQNLEMTHTPVPF